MNQSPILRRERERAERERENKPIEYSTYFEGGSMRQERFNTPPVSSVASAVQSRVANLIGVACAGLLTVEQFLHNATVEVLL